MDEEVEMLYALWQKIETGKAAWIEEISRRHRVPAPTDLSSVYSLRIHADGPGAAAAMADCTEVLTSVDLVHRNICSFMGVPYRNRLTYRNGADLWGREPLETITETSLYFIDVALIGPLGQVIELIAKDPRLMAAARTRLLYSSTEDGWTNRISEILARVDSIIACNSIDAVLTEMGNQCYLQTGISEALHQGCDA